MRNRDFLNTLSSWRLGCWCRERTSVEPGQFARGLALRQLKVNASQRREAGTDALIEIAPRRTRCPREGRLKDTPGFGFHGMAVLRRADTQPLLDRRIEVADRDAAHGCIGASSVCMISS